MDELHWFINQDFPQNKGRVAMMISTGRESENSFLGSPGHGSRINQILSDFGSHRTSPRECGKTHVFMKSLSELFESFDPFFLHHLNKCQEQMKVIVLHVGANWVFVHACYVYIIYIYLHMYVKIYRAKSPFHPATLPKRRRWITITNTTPYNTI